MLQRHVQEAAEKVAEAKEPLTALEEKRNAAEREEDSEEDADENIDGYDDVTRPRLTPNVPSSIVQSLQTLAQTKRDDLPNDVQQAMVLLHSFLESNQ